MLLKLVLDRRIMLFRGDLYDLLDLLYLVEVPITISQRNKANPILEEGRSTNMDLTTEFTPVEYVLL